VPLLSTEDQVDCCPWRSGRCFFLLYIYLVCVCCWATCPFNRLLSHTGRCNQIIVQNENCLLITAWTTTFSLRLLFNDAVSIKTIQRDDRMINKYRGVCGMGIGKGNLSTWRRPTPVPLRQSQIPHDMTWDWTWVQTASDQLSEWWHDLITTFKF
jgi:hypothetical protein